MNDRKISSYFLYAIGEIALIVVGIMIALQIDNWNENRKKHDEISISINNLHEEFQSNSNVLKFDINRLSRVSISLKTLLSLTGQKTDLSDVEFDSLIQYASQVPTFNASTLILEELKASGNMSLLKDNELKNAFYAFERELTNLDEVHHGFQTTSTNLQEFLKANSSFFLITKSKLTKSNKHLLDNIVFTNHLSHKDNIANNMFKWYDKLQIIIDTILMKTKNYAG